MKESQEYEEKDSTKVGRAPVNYNSFHFMHSFLEMIFVCIVVGDINTFLFSALADDFLLTNIAREACLLENETRYIQI